MQRSIDGRDDAIDAFRTLGRADDDVLLVVDEERGDRVLGLVTQDELVSAYRIVRERRLAGEGVGVA